ncbi:MAG: alkaline metalloproteinase [Phyllobacteriaceae bacterium]|nr:alkaline metalloproteinase [Phyllobacteriaceae bacterium]
MCALCSNIFSAPTCIEVGAGEGQTSVTQGTGDTGAFAVPPVFQPTYEVETTDFAGSTATTGTLELGVTHYGTISASGDEDWYAIDLVAGQTYEFRLHGVGLNQNPDPYLYVRDGNGNTVAFNDDAGSSVWGNGDARDSRVVFTPTTSGTYYVSADSYQNYFGDYMLTAVTYNSSGMDFTVDEIAWQLTNNGGFLFGDDVQAFDVGPDGQLTVNITALTADGQALARAALRQWSDLTGIQFVETTGTAEITFDDSDSGTNAYANTVVSGTTITSATVMVTTGWLNQFGTGFNSYSYETYVHEIGHALGLFHGGNYNGSASYGTDNYYINDSVAYTIMSYMQANGDEFSSTSFGWNTYVGADFRYMLTPVLSDYIAIEMLYGRSTNTRTGNTTYGYGSNTGNAQLDNAVNYGSDVNFMVHDDGGIDTLNFSQSSANQSISLEADSLSSVLGGIFNMSISRGTVIENAFGGSGNDRIFGNSVNNIQNGNAGNDTIFGSLGNDTLNGGAGFDTLSYASSNAAVQVFLGGNTATGGHATGDTISGFENLVGSNFNDRLFGSAQVNLIDGGNGDDIILGNNGNDTLRGREGRDIIYGGNHSDTFVYFALSDSGMLFGDRDRIQDFQNGLDRFDLSAIDANTTLAGNQAFTYVGSFFSGTAGQLRSFENAGLTFIEGDVNGDGVADFRIELLGTNLGINAADFIL